MSKLSNQKLLKQIGIAMKDDRLSNSHRNLYLALLLCWKEQLFPMQIKITRKDLMHRSNICSSSTYHLAINRLIHLRYIQYIPSYDPYQGSIAQLLNT
ncbi:hypothetical protein [Pedobacter chinensis]|uniref:hypothetical protein n=1 Tax=Pedobacter chinensis TaxID=2282421 RepID=UPI0011C08277|nr:hypothetical protein [Pedobacter chinensis]